MRNIILPVSLVVQSALFRLWHIVWPLKAAFVFVALLPLVRWLSRRWRV